MIRAHHFFITICAASGSGGMEVNMNDIEFRSLFEAAQKGDSKAAKEIIDMFMPSMYKNSFINGNLDDDCLQELTIRFINCIRNFNFNTNKDFTEYLTNFDNER